MGGLSHETSRAVRAQRASGGVLVCVRRTPDAQNSVMQGNRKNVTHNGDACPQLALSGVKRNSIVPFGESAISAASEDSAARRSASWKSLRAARPGKLSAGPNEPIPISFFAALSLLSEGPAPAPDTYTLGPGDQIVVRVPDFEEIDNKSIPIDLKGSVNLPAVGRIQASGLTTEQLEAAIAERLKKYLVKPDVSVYLTEMRSQPVSILGQVQTPGVHQLQGQKNLFEVLSLAGGLRPGGR